MRLIFAGTPEAALPSLLALINSPRHEVVAVVTRPDAVSGRGRRVNRSPVAELAQEHGIEILAPARADDADFIARLRELEPDCAPVVAYGNLLTREVLDIPRAGWVNLHFSLLPAWRGAAPVQAAIRAGDEMTGAATFQIERSLDTGPVFGLVTERVRDTDTAGELLARLAESGAMLLESTMDGIEDGALQAVPQSPEGVSYAEKITVDSARVRWSDPAVAVDRHIRAVTPDPGAWTMIDETRVKLGPVHIAAEVDLAPGQIEVAKRAVHVGTASAAVRLGDVQPPGKKPMAAADWARGARLTNESRAL